MSNKYSEDFRLERLSSEPLYSFITTNLTKEQIKSVMTSEEFLFVADNNYPLSIDNMEHVLSCFDIDESLDSVVDIMSQTWKVLPDYYKRFKQFYEQAKFDPLSFMSDILLVRLNNITSNQLHQAGLLPDNYYLSLDSGLILKSPVKELHTYNHIVSRSLSKLKQAVRLIEEFFWNDIDIEGILKSIKSNKTDSYYNISKDNYTNSIKRSSNISDKYKIIANKTDRNLFNHIVELLNKEELQSTHKFNKLSLFINSVSESSESTKDSTIDSSYDTSYSSEEKETVNKMKRNNIPLKVRQMTWRKYIGDTMDGKCWCCDYSISIENWHAGHVIAYSKGGPNSVDNLRPLCQGCNLSMGNRPMQDYVNEHKLTGKGAIEFGIEKDLANLTI